MTDVNGTNVTASEFGVSNDFQGILSFVVGTIGAMLNFSTAAVFIRGNVQINKAAKVLLLSQLFFDGVAGLMLALRLFVLPLHASLPAVFGVLCLGVKQGMFLWIFFTASAYNIVAVAVQRFVVTMFPFQHVGRKNAYVMLLFSLLAAVFLCATYWSVEITVNSKDETCLLKYDTTAMVIWTVFYYCIPTALLVSLYTVIIYNLRQRKELHKTGPKNIETHIVKNAIAVATVFILCAGPNAITATLASFEVINSDYFESNLRVLTHGFTMFNSVSTPIVYVIFLRSLRQRLKNILCNGKRIRRLTSISVHVSTAPSTK